MLDGIARLAADEDASAAVEMAVLLPVYLLLLAGLLTTGHLVLVRQGVVMATRYRAWEPLNARPRASADDLSRAFFPIFHNDTGDKSGGVFASPPVVRRDWRATQRDLAFAGDGATRVGRAPNLMQRPQLGQLALALLNNDARGDRPTIRTSQAVGMFPYRAKWVPTFGIGSLVSTPSCRASVLLPSLAERAGHVDRRQEHPIERYGMPGRSFQPSQNRYNSPTAPLGDVPVFPTITDTGGLGRPPGIWDPDYRLGGGPNPFPTEWGFVQTIAR